MLTNTFRYGILYNVKGKATDTKTKIDKEVKKMFEIQNEEEKAIELMEKAKFRVKSLLDIGINYEKCVNDLTFYKNKKNKIYPQDLNMIRGLMNDIFYFELLDKLGIKGKFVKNWNN